MRTRVVITNSEAETERGAKLLNFIFDICHDGKVTFDEVVRLHAFLVEPPVAFAAIGYLRAVTRQIVSDDKISDIEAYALKQSLARVTPKSMRGVILTHLEGIGLPLSNDERPSGRGRKASGWRSDPITPAQSEYIANLGGKITPGMTKGDASILIDYLLENRPPTPRQQMVIRFFNRLDLLNNSKEDVSAWIDAVFGDDTSIESRAWERFKRETKHDVHSLDINIVPINAYSKYAR